jgi:hypothetical protein
MVVKQRRNFRDAPFQNIFPPPSERLISEIRSQSSRRKMILEEIDRQRCFADLTTVGGLLILASSHE